MIAAVRHRDMASSPIHEMLFPVTDVGAMKQTPEANRPICSDGVFGEPKPREELIMVVIRNVFRLKFGKAREAVALFKEGVAIQKRVGAGLDFSTRLLTDVTGPFYTVVLEITVPNLAAFEGAAPQLMGDKDWQANYQKIGALVESGYREIFTLVE